MQVFEIKLHDALLDSIDRFDKVSFLTNQQQPNFKRAKPERSLAEKSRKIFCHARDKLTFLLFSN